MPELLPWHVSGHSGLEQPGRRVAFVEAEVLDPDGKLITNASSSLLIFDVGS